MYRKSYTGLSLWMLIFVAALLGICFLPAESDEQPMRLIMLLMVWGITGMAWMIWRTEYVYWYNGTSFEDAEAAGSERRKEFAWKHVKVFGAFSLVMTAVVCGPYLLGASAWINFTAGTVGLVIAACCTIPFKL